MKKGLNYIRLAIMAIVAVMAQGLCSCSNEESDDIIGGKEDYYSVIIDVRNSEGENLLNPSTEDNYVGQPITVTMIRYRAFIDETSYEETYEADWTEAAWDKAMWRVYDSDKETPSESLLKQVRILSEDKQISTSTDKLLYIGLFPENYVFSIKIEWPDGRVDYLRTGRSSSAETSYYWYVNNRRAQEFSPYASPDNALTIVH